MLVAIMHSFFHHVTLEWHIFRICVQRCYQDQGVRDQDQTGRDQDWDQDQGGQDQDQDQDQDLKKVVLIGLETKTRSRDMYAMLLYKSSKS